MESNKTEKTPVRRVGSLTLGFGLMAVGVFFLCYYFVPQFNWELALKIAPAAGLCLLGGEVLYFAAKPEKWKYDFLSVFYCLLLMVVCLCVGALPMVLDRFGPENEMRVAKITAEYEPFRLAAKLLWRCRDGGHCRSGDQQRPWHIAAEHRTVRPL